MIADRGLPYIMLASSLMPPSLMDKKKKRPHGLLLQKLKLTTIINLQTNLFYLNTKTNVIFCYMTNFFVFLFALQRYGDFFFLQTKEERKMAK